jgi:predicted O-linked N-acetylglucosamine transferase (SPINDLY family)
VTAFQPFSPSPDISILPSLSADHFTFGSFNRPNKFSDAVFSVWAKVLGAVPKSRMLLGNMIGDSMAKDVIARFAALGIDRSRLVLHERSSLPEYLRLHHQVDLLLDTFPYGGGTTTNHGLWMGIPTLTLAGDTFASRVGASLMYQQGLTEFIAYSQQDYLDKAVDWSSRRVELADIRQNMRKHLENLPERSEEFFAKTLEAMLRTMWKRYCTGKLPESFEVEV